MVVPDTAMQIFYQNITFAKGCILEENGSLHTQQVKVSRNTGTILMLIGISILLIGGMIWIVTLLSNQLPQASPDGVACGLLLSVFVSLFSIFSASLRRYSIYSIDSTHQLLSRLGGFHTKQESGHSGSSHSNIVE